MCKYVIVSCMANQ